jgi:DNA-directed RNA polymerase specialized sigma24 family protein
MALSGEARQSEMQGEEPWGAELLELWRLLVPWFSARLRSAGLGDATNAEDLASITVTRVFAQLLRGPLRDMHGVVVADVAAWGFGVGKNVWREYLRGPERFNRGLEETLGTPAEPAAVERVEEDDERREQLARAMEHCLRALPEADRTLLAHYYDDTSKPKEVRRRLAGELGTSVPHIQTRAGNIKRALRRCIAREYPGLSRRMVVSRTGGQEKVAQVTDKR